MAFTNYYHQPTAGPSSTKMSTFSQDSFAWPTAWFDVPALSPARFAFRTTQYAYASELDLDALPELDHSRTPESPSPTQLHDACTTPSQDPNLSVSAVCDVPLLAPRPLPFTSPTFLKFDYLPDEDEDLSYPPYTHSRKHRKRPLHDSNSNSNSNRFCPSENEKPFPSTVIPTSQLSPSQPPSKRRKLAAPASASQRNRHPALLPVNPIPHTHSQSAVRDQEQPHRFPQLLDYFGPSSTPVSSGWT